MIDRVSKFEDHFLSTHFLLLFASTHCARMPNRRAFTLLEMVVVVGILMVLLTMGISLSNGTGRNARKVDTDKLLGLIEQARIAAITSRCYIVLGIAEPEFDERYRIGLFKVDEWPDTPIIPFKLKGKLLNRWQNLNTGIALIGGDVEEIKNLLDEPKITLIYGEHFIHTVEFTFR